MGSFEKTKQYVDVAKLETLRKEKGYSILYINSTILGYKNRDTYRLKCKSKISFNIRDLILLSNLYDVFIDELIIFKEEEEI